MAIVLTVILVLVVRIGLSFAPVVWHHVTEKLYEVRYLLSATMYYRSLHESSRPPNESAHV